MVNAVECWWSKEQAKALITFLLAERERHRKDIDGIDKAINRLKERYGISDKEIRGCEEMARIFINF